MPTFEKYRSQGFSGSSVVKNPPASVGDVGSIPNSGRTPHATEQVHLCATTIEPVLQSLGAAATEAHMP